MLCSLIALGDSHGNVSYFHSVVESIVTNETNIDAILHAGDIFSENAYDDDSLNEIRRLESEFDVFVARGNHDSMTTSENFCSMSLFVITFLSSS
jgi:DNA repair exonuclease SbcCD nuclease subunit